MPADVCLSLRGLLRMTARVSGRQLQGSEIGAAVNSGGRRSCADPEGHARFRTRCGRAAGHAQSSAPSGVAAKAVRLRHRPHAAGRIRRCLGALGRLQGRRGDGGLSECTDPRTNPEADPAAYAAASLTHPAATRPRRPSRRARPPGSQRAHPPLGYAPSAWPDRAPDPIEPAMFRSAHRCR